MCFQFSFFANMKVSEIINQFRLTLRDLYSQGELEQVIFLCFEDVMHFNKIDLTLKGEDTISIPEEKRFLDILEELKTGKPVQYVLGYAWFSGMKFFVNENVLIPRQETEELVDWVIKDEGMGRQVEIGNSDDDTMRRLDHNATSGQLKVTKNILDVCTGSGCIAIALKKNLVEYGVTAVDISESALAIAKKNAEFNHTIINFIQADILQTSNFKFQTITLTPNPRLPTSLDVIVSNPPYILESEKKLMTDRVLNYEPHLALFVPNDDPLLFYKRIADFALTNLKPGGRLYFEINEAKGREVSALLEEKGFSDIELKEDLNGKDRMVRGEKLSD